MKAFAIHRWKAAKLRYDDERERLTAAMSLAAPGSADHAALQRALQHSAEDYTESEVATTEMEEYYYTAKAMLGSEAPAPSCKFLACGENAACHTVDDTARCKCEPCFEGDGFKCRPVPCTPETIGSALPVRGPMPPGYPAVPRQTTGEAAELQLAVFGQDQLAVVLRESSNGHLGALVLGQVKGTEVHWGNRLLLSPTLAAFGPVVAGFPNGKLAIGFRDRDADGVAYLMGAHSDTTKPLEAMLSGPQPLARKQAQRMVLVALASSRVVCLYAENVVDEAGAVQEAFGSAALVEVLSGGNLHVLGTYRFSEGPPLALLSAVALSPTSLVAAYRAIPQKKAGPGQPSRELSAQWIGMADNELVIDPHPITLEPEHAQMWARDLALVAQDTFAYTYEAGGQATKMAILRVDPQTHRMSILDGPRRIKQGATAYVHSVSLPGGSAVPSTFTILQHPEESAMAEVCRVSPEGRVADCRDVAWSDQPLRAVSAGRLSDGRFALAFVDMSGNLLYQLLSGQEHGAMVV